MVGAHAAIGGNSCQPGAADHGCEPAPDLPCALFTREGERGEQNSGVSCRENAASCVNTGMTEASRLGDVARVSLAGGDRRQLQLDARAEIRNADSRTRRQMVRGEIALPHRVERRLVGELGHEDRHLQDAGEIGAGPFEQGLQLTQHIVGLARHVEPRIFRHDTAEIKHVVMLDDLVEQSFIGQGTFDHDGIRAGCGLAGQAQGLSQ